MTPPSPGCRPVGFACNAPNHWSFARNKFAPPPLLIATVKINFSPRQGEPSCEPRAIATLESALPFFTSPVYSRALAVRSRVRLTPSDRAVG
jgi:hypothetical protein